ncbi:uncharacterized protein Z519_04283 [Cladophialophora bantiana CBS 173.52]|uniref:Major facilitator superfamily (MFS) profile domain-containing protein n=1 Tax=Cladophialophora bantiana (strain ATCC 10958 / CBS 173.52 / CDC B-1940 / NIH 8579) TaxID=1442370 RepID=A0A0D2HQH3_CLAB1|nr:uncharacterized protein Z519_04283 [Cladophialophora bantiana CBS 173.52]KIW95698.1 hypothetical protein Z519_04283 [Cladophialophora bantiana CBS 173.52]
MSETTTTELAPPASALLAPQAPTVQDDRNLSQTLPRTVAEQRPLRKGSTAVIFVSVTGVTGISSLLAGLITVILPTLAKDLNLPGSVLLWPSSIYALTCGCSLILSGAVADVVGNRFMYLLGCLLQSAFTLACGLAQNSLQLLFFRALAGVAIAFCLPSAVSLITSYFPHGRRRNFAFAMMGAGQPVGFSIGLVVGGILTDGPGWRAGFYIAAAINTILFALAVTGLPKPVQPTRLSVNRLATDIDWPGALILSTALGLLSYVFAVLTGNVSSIKSPTNIACLSTAAALIPAFVFWVGRQEKLNRPAIIPNSLWRNRVFTGVCIDVFLAWGAFNATETLLTFFFQDVQRLSATQTSLRFLPSPASGIVTNILMGLAVHKVRADWAVIFSMAISCLSPLLVAIMKVRAPYWEYVFPAITLNAIGPDVLFTVSNLVITAAFPERTQALAGGVFNTVAQIGKSVGLALSAVIAGSITMQSDYPDKHAPKALMEGYRAAFWFCVALTSSTLVVSLWGLRSIGKIGLKRE